MDLIHPRRLQNLFLWLLGKLFRNHNGQISNVFLDLTPQTNAFGFGGGTLSDDVSSSSIGWWVSVAVVFFCRVQISHAFFLVLYRKWSKYCWPKLHVVQSTKLFVFCCSLLKNFNFGVIQFKRALLWRY